MVHDGAVAGIAETAAGQRARLGTFAGPCAVDKIAVLGDGRHSATWEVLRSATVRRVPRQPLLELIEDVPAVCRHALSHLAHKARRAQSALVLASTTNTMTRTALWLVEQLPGPGGIVPLPAEGQQGLAETIGASRVATNRALQQLAREELIRVEGRGRVRGVRPELPAARARLARR